MRSSVNRDNVKRGLWITWEFQRRNLGLSAALDWPLIQIEICSNPFLRYLLSLHRTLRIVMQKRPAVVAVQNPSIVLAVFGVLLSNVFKFKLIVDAHNSGIYPREGGCSVLMAVANWVQRKADLTIVTNCSLKNVVSSHGGRAVVLPDRLPDVPKGTIDKKLEGEVNIVFICTFSNDEPYEEVIEAARLISNNVVIYITGRYEGKVESKNMPSNIRLQGFLDEVSYWSLLKSSDIVMDLTTREDCLVCGAYEAVSLDKPLILSDTVAIRYYFNQGCVYVGDSRDEIASGVNSAIRDICDLQKEIVGLHHNIDTSWKNKFDDFVCCVRAIQ